MRLSGERRKKHHHVLANLFLVVLFILGLSFFIYADDIAVMHGHPYYLDLESQHSTQHWAALKVTNNAIPLDESNTPFTSISFVAPTITGVAFPGANLKDEAHYYAAMLPNSFHLDNVLNMTPEDLYAGAMFYEENFSIFYPNYDSKNDNPEDTFCCDEVSIAIGGVNFTAYRTVLEVGIDYYLLRYNNSGRIEPLFIAPFKDQMCYNHTLCVAEFILPLADSPYNFFVLSRFPTYDYLVYIDGVQTSIFSQTALPYNLTIRVRNTYTEAYVPFLDVLVGENDGQNIFIPYRMSGYLSKAYSIGITDENGWETFLAAPTVYPSTDNYSIYLAVPRGNLATNIYELSVTSKDEVVRQSKPLSPTTLYDNAKVSVNAMNQINSDLFKWASENEEAKKFLVRYYINSGNWLITDQPDSTGELTLKTGAPNVISVTVRNGSNILSGYTVKIKESEGYLIVDPYTASSPLREKQRLDFQTMPTATEFIVTPTSYGSINSTITLEIINPYGAVVASKPAIIISSLGVDYGDGVYYSNDLLKTIVNSINAVLNSLFYALNN